MQKSLWDVVIITACNTPLCKMNSATHFLYCLRDLCSHLHILPFAWKTCGVWQTHQAMDIGLLSLTFYTGIAGQWTLLPLSHVSESLGSWIEETFPRALPGSLLDPWVFLDSMLTFSPYFDCPIWNFPSLLLVHYHAIVNVLFVPSLPSISQPNCLLKTQNLLFDSFT